MAKAPRKASDLPTAHPEIQVWAAGGVIWRATDNGLEVLLAHRPRQRDWTFPKGKLDDGETLRRCALREVEEETGLRCTTGERLPMVTYRDGSRRRKAVVYWTMTVDGGSFTPNAEVDAVGWFDPASAATTLTYRHDVELLSAFEASGAARSLAS